MTTSRRFLLYLAAGLALAADARFPGKEWERARPGGWSEAGLRRAREFTAAAKTAAVMIVQDGAIVDEWGQTARKFNCHSMRKSMMSALYGIVIADGKIRREKTLAELGIDDHEPALTALEKRATVADLLKARSGVYHPALYETIAMTLSKPARGSHAPGTFWHYNNWDFNALLTIFEQETGTKYFEEFYRRIAEPIGMQDYTTADGEYVRGEQSIHAAYPMRLTARDLARFGLLMAREGQWNGRQIVPKEWLKESTSSYSDTERKLWTGYGYMWWVGEQGFAALGAGGHFVYVLPKQDLVVVHRVNTDERHSVAEADLRRLWELIRDAMPQPVSVGR
jgi:CubicO group peptidase (beta-lactamase class C family)